MILATIRVSGVQALTHDYPSIPAGLVGGEVAFAFEDPLWDTLTKTAVFRGCVTRDVLIDGSTVRIPAEAVAQRAPRLMVGVYGTDADNNVVIPTLWCSLGSIRDAADPSGDPGTDPDLPIWAQLQERVEDLEENSPDGPVEDGEDGGYYTPAVTQPADNTIQLDWTPSKNNMPAVDPVQVTIPGSGGNADQVVLKSPDGTAWNITVSNSGVITATKVTSGGESDEPENVPTTLETYTIFVPENVSDEWTVTGGNGTLNMSTAEFLELFYDGFVSAPPEGVVVTKTSIGKDESGQYDMWEYDFCPTNYSRSILLSSGMHTYELPASFGLANFIGHLYNDTGNDAFDYIRANVRVKVIPVVNPWGFNQYPKTYGNVNGVNPNRNFDLNGEWASFPAYTPDENEWNVKGEYPFSEAEAQNLARWAEENWNAEFWIDCHTGEGYANKDLWVYYSSDSVILDRINGGISAIETWFKATYGTDCVTTRTIDSDGSIRLRWAEEIAGIPGMTLEQAPKRTTFGTSASNEAADISNYSTNISTFVQEFLLEKYRSTESVEITGVSVDDISIPYDTKSVTVTAVMTPDTTTQNKFSWTSDNEAVCVAYGCSDKAVIVPKQAGTAIITVTNHEESTVLATFNVTVEEAQTYTITNNLTNVTTSNNVESVASGGAYTATLTPDEGMAIQSVVVTMGGVDVTSTAYSDGVVNLTNVSGDVVITAIAETSTDAIQNELSAEIKGFDYTTGLPTENDARILSDYIPVEGSSKVSLSCTDGFYIKAFEFDQNKIAINPKGTSIGKFTSNTANGTVVASCCYVRILLKKSDNTAITADDFNSVWIDFSGTMYKLKETDLDTPVYTTADLVCTIGSIDTTGADTEGTNRVRTDFIPMKNWIGTVEVSVDGIPFEEYLGRKYDADKQFTGSSPSGWTAVETTLSGIAAGTGYIRYVFCNSDDSDIALSDIAGSITIKYGNFYTTYNLTSGET